MVDFLYGMNWKRFIKEKMDENGETYHFLGRTRKWYRYQKLVPVPIDRRALVPVPVQVVPIPMLPTTLFSYPLHF